MTEHLPECPMSTKDAICCSLACVCEALRACEQRVSCEYLTPAALALTGMGDPRYAKGYADGLDAAREVVVSVGTGSGYVITRNLTLAAIDALRGEP